MRRNTGECHTIKALRRPMREHMEAYDKLPKWLRKIIRESGINWSSIGVHEDILRCNFSQEQTRQHYRKLAHREYLASYPGIEKYIKE